MRGKPFLQCKVFLQYRITPADAGKTNRPVRSRCRCWDHPRGCGENLCFRFSVATTAGSPPRMRGKPRKGRSVRLFAGITPADAGKTIFLYSFLSKNRDHPRGCGENFRTPQKPTLKTGSPPRMRGKLQAATGANTQKRITPADAGKTSHIGFYVGKTQDHPRGCGENTETRPGGADRAGSPPRMRGKPPYAAAGAYTIGITPADAGKTEYQFPP